MTAKRFAEIRRHFGKTQGQMALVLGVSPKAIQSFEQGWRAIPMHIERQTLLLLALKHQAAEKAKPCWLLRECPPEKREACPAWQFNAGHLCWFINGTICHGKGRGCWDDKMKLCGRCDIFRSILPKKL